MSTDERSRDLADYDDTDRGEGIEWAEWVEWVRPESVAEPMVTYALRLPSRTGGSRSYG